LFRAFFAASALWCVAAGAASAQAAATAALEHQLTAEEIRSIARREVLWCDEYRASSDDCDALTLIRLAPDGRLIETTSLLISESPRLIAFIGDIDEITDNRVCSKVKAADMPITFTLDGKVVPKEAAAGLRALLATSLTEFDGKTVCQTFFRGEDPTRLREEVTVDGVRREDLETRYLLREGTDGFSLRPQVTGDEKPPTRL
jgi:hypothetical protein